MLRWHEVSTDHEAARAVAERIVSSEPAFVSALDGTVVAWNRGAAALLGVGGGRAVGWPCWRLVAGRDPDGVQICRQGCSVLRQAAGGSAPAPADVVVTGPRGRRTLRFQHLVLEGSSGEPLAVLHLLEDVDAVRRQDRVAGRTRRLTSGLDRTGPGLDVEAVLTPREIEVLSVLTRGCTAREAAEMLHISHATARTHIQRILVKLGAHNRISALAIAVTGAAGGSEPRRSGL
jgi:DNA-binding CsgD family transcriptional regulator